MEITNNRAFIKAPLYLAVLEETHSKYRTVERLLRTTKDAYAYLKEKSTNQDFYTVSVNDEIIICTVAEFEGNNLVEVALNT